MNQDHHYSLTLTWTGNKGTGTSAYTAYERSHDIEIEGKPVISGSSDAPFRGDVQKHNPEDLLLASLSGCHMLWYLHLCADAGIIVTAYIDHPTGTLTIGPSGGSFSTVTLHPVVTVEDLSMIDRANALHKSANEKCFIANSVRFPVNHSPRCIAES